MFALCVLRLAHLHQTVIVQPLTVAFAQHDALTERSMLLSDKVRLFLRLAGGLAPVVSARCLTLTRRGDMTGAATF